MRGRRLASVIAMCAVAVACGKKSSNPSSDSMRAQLEELKKKFPDQPSGPQATGDPCSLLDPTEVAAAIGPLASPPYRGTYRPDRGNSSCRYDTKDSRRLLIDVDWSGGPVAMKMIHFGRSMTDQAMQGELKKGKTVLATGDTVTGDWDEVAAEAMQCCMLAALRGDQMIQIDWTGTKLTTAGAAALLNKALNRLDHRLAIDGNGGEEAGNQRYQTESKDSLVNVCSLVPQKDVEAIFGAPLTGPPEREGGQRSKLSCTYHTAIAGGGNLRNTCELELHEWHDAHVAFAEDQWIVNRGGRAIGKVATGVADSMTGKSAGGSGASGDSTHPAAQPASESAGPPGTWDEVGPSAALGLEAVKGNVLMRAGSMGLRAQCDSLMNHALIALRSQASKG